MGALFGTAGVGESFKEAGYKRSVDAPGYLKKLGLDCYEYQCGRGLKIKKETAAAIAAAAKKEKITLSLHSPYYISLSSVDEVKRENSVGYILESARAADWMGANRVVIHPGSAAKIERSAALKLAKETLKKSLKTLDQNNLGHITVCPETMGRLNLLGDLDEILELCRIDDRLVPCIDFGHLNARTFGGIKDISDYEKILDTVQDRLGSEKLKNLHIHFTKIQYSDTAGEVRHLTLEDDKFGPQFEPLCELIFKRKLSPVIICESDGTQAEDAAKMKGMYREFG
ncbi:MAG: TIM barrel protein [Oscillospiraceae bacterium]|nr:TIM barrel protein [Oscillospiraceae bacterium]